MTVGQLEDAMTARELEEWMALDHTRHDRAEREQENADRVAKSRAKHMQIYGKDPL